MMASKDGFLAFLARKSSHQGRPLILRKRDYSFITVDREGDDDRFGVSVALTRAEPLCLLAATHMYDGNGRDSGHIRVFEKLE